MLCDMFRRDLAMAVLRDEVSLEALRVQATDATLARPPDITRDCGASVIPLPPHYYKRYSWKMKRALRLP